MLFCLIFILFVPTSVYPRVVDISIKATIFDPAGKETSLVYDGGKVEITCWHNDTRTEALQLQEVQNVGSKHRYVTIANSSYNGYKLQHNIFINPTVEKTKYRCIGEDNRVISPLVVIDYVLCNPISVTPRRVCPGNGVFCHRVRGGLPVCKGLTEYGCLLGYSYNTFNVEILQVLPKFNVFCGTRLTDELGLCYSLFSSPNQRVRFVTTKKERCKFDFRLYICGKDCNSKKKLTVMAGWHFVDIADQFSTYVQLETEATDIPVNCDIVHVESGKPVSKKVRFAARNQELSNAAAISKRLKQLPTPSIADIICDVAKGDDTLLRYQTSLLVFRHDRDLHYNVMEKKVVFNGDKESHKFTINATVADGLSVCVKTGKTRCTPTETTNTSTAETGASNPQEEDYIFNVGLFASSPKRKFVSVYKKIIRRSGTPTKAKSHGLAKGSVWKIVLSVIILVIVAVAVAAMITFVVLRVKRKKAKQQQGGREEEIGTPAVTASKSLYKDPAVTASKSLYKDVDMTLSPSRTEFNVSSKQSSHAYDTVNSRGQD